MTTKICHGCLNKLSPMMGGLVPHELMAYVDKHFKCDTCNGWSIPAVPRCELDLYGGIPGALVRTPISLETRAIKYANLGRNNLVKR